MAKSTSSRSGPQNFGPNSHNEWDLPQGRFYYDKAEDDLGIVAQDHLTLEKIASKVGRYEVAAATLRDYMVDSEISNICDAYCGSGFGTDILRSHFGSKVYGMEPNDRALEYCHRRYPDAVFRNESIPKNDVLLLLDAHDRVSPAEFKMMASSTDILMVGVPFALDMFFAPGMVRCDTAEELHEHMQKVSDMNLVTMIVIDGCDCYALGETALVLAMYAKEEVL